MIRDIRIRIDGRSTRYLEAGAGWPVILLHAFPLNADMWRPQLERVPAGWRMIAPDFRGFGPGAPSPGGAADREPEPLALTIDDLASDIDALMDALEIGEAVIGGLSMGGYVAFALARRVSRAIHGAGPGRYARGGRQHRRARRPAQDDRAGSRPGPECRRRSDGAPASRAHDSEDQARSDHGRAGDD